MSVSPNSRTRPVLQHLNELRIRLIRVGIVMLVLIVVALIFYRQIIGFFTSGVSDIIADAGGQIASRSIAEPWTVAARVAIMSGLVAATPYLLFEIWLYLRSALKRSEKGTFLLVVPGVVFFFALGAAFAYYVVAPFFFRFLVGFGSAISGLTVLPSLESTVGTLVSLMFSLGLVFQVPMVLYVLGRLGLVRHGPLARKRRWVILIAVVAGAALTPTVDPLTQLLVAVPIVLLFEFGLFLMWWNERAANRRKAKSATRA